MARGTPFRPGLHEGLLDLLRPPSPQLAAQLSERLRPRLAEVGRDYAGRSAAEARAALEDVVRSAGGVPDLDALTEFAEQIEAGGNPFV